MTDSTIAKPSALAAKPHPVKPSSPSTVVVASSDPSKWGRVDADGTVYLKTADGERVIGSWQAGEPEEALSHYGRRFDDLATEVSLLEARLSSGAGDARKTKTAAEAMAESLPEATVIGDIDGLSRRLKAIIEHSDEASAQAKEEREKQRTEATARKEQLAAEAEELSSNSTQWKVAGDRLHEILEEWKTIRGVDRKVDDALWKRFSKARESFNRRRGAHFADMDRERATARTRKEELCVQAEELSSSTDWATTASAFRGLLADWKAAGRAPRDIDDALWKRFKAAQDVFFAARNANASERDAEFGDNAKAKVALLERFEKIVDPSSGLDGAKSHLRELQVKWDEIGKVPRERVRELEDRLHAIERRVRDAEDQQWRRSDPEAMARAAQFRDRVTQFEEQAAKAEAAGRKRDAEKARAQAQQWREWAEAAEQAVTRR
ncbi:DUF349 domain-containing protein [Smaragdicoccus niigatensis]|uniref:DUF349 domain-containing protein n=1 Tax=Smaragdicoccus niigatensis TaxID=359359 RepID=UPI00039EC331|nr:DUF349 domain-containing protein [Smaragdicoccus niigatensis]